MKKMKIWALAMGCGLVALPSWSQTIAVDNFGESPNNGSFSTYYLGQTFGENNGWKVTGVGAIGSIDVITGAWQSPDGLNSLDMDGYNPGAIATTIDVTQAGRVTVDFWMAANTAGTTTKVMDVQLGSAPAIAASFVGKNYTYSDMGWQQMSVVFDITDPGNLTLSFASEDSAGDMAGPALGTVTAFETVPDTGSSLLLLSLGAASLICVRRRMAVAS